MQSLAGLPRLIAGTRRDPLGGLRPGVSERGTADRDDLPETPLQHDPAGGPYPRRPRGRLLPGRPRAPGHRRRRKRIALAGFLVAVGLASLAAPDAIRRGTTQAIGWLDRAAVGAGFEISHVAVAGYRNTPLADILAALELDTQRSLIGFDTGAARTALRRLPWIERVRVVHILPDTVSIEVSERTPVAIWQSGGKRHLIDAEGRVLGPVTLAHAGHLPWVVGAGAPRHAQAMIARLEQRKMLADRVQYVVREGRRRWTLQLDDGRSVLLPEVGEAAALDIAADLFAAEADNSGLANTAAWTVLDLRIAGRPTMRLGDGFARLWAKHRRAQRKRFVLAGVRD